MANETGRNLGGLRWVAVELVAVGVIVLGLGMYGSQYVSDQAAMHCGPTIWPSEVTWWLRLGGGLLIAVAIFFEAARPGRRGWVSVLLIIAALGVAALALAFTVFVWFVDGVSCG
ncbi:MAG: hypothetical protein NVSMB48_23710 [Marmoricola sp.]